jgi:uncharacterized delta-60 repeat protein
MAIWPRDNRLLRQTALITGLLLLLTLPVHSADRPAGHLDFAFGHHGQITTDFFNRDDSASAVAFQEDGKTVVAGVSFGDNADFALARYLLNGSLDTSFGTGGILLIDFGADEYARAVAIQADGKILVAGATANGDGMSFALARCNTDGSLDLDFGSGGLTTTAFGDAHAGITDLLLLPESRILAGGIISPSTDFLLVCYNSDGSEYAGFGTNGAAVIDFRQGEDYLLAMALQDDGKVLAAGVETPSGAFVLARLLEDGSRDAGFGTVGLVVTDFQLDINGLSAAVVVQPDGRIVVGSTAERDLERHFALIRYLPDGILDQEFGHGGWAISDFFGEEQFQDLALQADGRILAVGTGSAGPSRDFFLARFNPDGSPDSSFGESGYVQTDFGGDDLARAMNLDPGGNIVVVGRTDIETRDFAVARYLSQSFSPALALDGLFSLLEILEISNPGGYQSLRATLQVVREQVERNNLRASARALRAFTYQVRSQLSTGRMPPAIGHDLLDQASHLLNIL